MFVVVKKAYINKSEKVQRTWGVGSIIHGNRNLNAGSPIYWGVGSSSGVIKGTSAKW